MRAIRTILYGTVFLTGAAVLIIEVAAVRLLTPYFGSSLYVLSSVLTIILLALSLGYYLGGKTADRLPYHLPLYSIITSGGLLLLLLLTLSEYLLPAIGHELPLIIGPLFFSALLFFTPAFLLGIDSPYVITLLSRIVEEEHRGQVVGATFFWSTAGSITGSLASGFLLIPRLGLEETLVSTGIVLVLLGIGGGYILTHVWKRRSDYDTRNNRNLSAAVLVAVLLMIGLVYQLSSETVDAATLYEDDGYYSHIRIHDGTFSDEPVRYLSREVNNSSAIYLERDELVFAYSQFATMYPQLVADAESFLLLGGGAYTIPRAVHAADPDIKIDVVELEPSLYELSMQYFDLPDTPKIVNHVIDARVFLARSDEKYDVMFHDTFSSGHFMPPHLITKEFFAEVKDSLSPDGVMIINFISAIPSSDDSSLLGSFLKTASSIFPEIDVYLTNPEYTWWPQNIMAILKNNPDAPDLDPEIIVHNRDSSYALSELKRDPEEIISMNDVVFTDDHNPVEMLLLKERILLP